MNNIQMKHVTSSHIAAIGYEHQTSVLVVSFLNGSTYWYYNVSQFIYEAMVGADSIGSFFHANIKNKYQCQKIK